LREYPILGGLHTVPGRQKVKLAYGRI